MRTTTTHAPTNALAAAWIAADVADAEGLALPGHWALVGQLAKLAEATNPDALTTAQHIMWDARVARNAVAV